MPNSIDLAGLARKLDQVFGEGYWPDRWHLPETADFERVLRESKLPELIAAGQAMAGVLNCSMKKSATADNWDAALAAFLAATEGK